MNLSKTVEVVAVLMVIAAIAFAVYYVWLASTYV